MHPSPDIEIPVGSLCIDEDADQETKERLGRAIRACRKGRATQDEINERTGIGQSTLSSYEAGASVPTVTRVAAIERACGRPAGFILNHAGLIEVITTVLQAIEMDPDLDDGGRRAVRAYYDGAKRREDIGASGD